MPAYHKVEVSLNTNAVEVGVPEAQTVNVVLPLVGPTGPQGPAGEGSVESVNGQTGVVVLDAQDVGAEVGLEYISQAIDVAGNINALANKHYTFTKNVNDNISIRLPTLANEGDRIVIRRAGNNTQGVLTVDRLGGQPSVQTIGVLPAPETVFYAVWSGLWRQDFIPPAGFQGTPASVTAFGTSGQMAYQDPHLYICVSTNTWRRVTLTTF